MTETVPSGSLALAIGDPAPWVALPSTSQARHHRDLVSGHYTILFFFGSASSLDVSQVLGSFLDWQTAFAALGIHFLGVSIDPQDQPLSDRLTHPETASVLWDLDAELSMAYGVCRPAPSSGIDYDPTTIILDPNLRVLALLPLDRSIDHVQSVIRYLDSLPPTPAPAPVTHQAPVLLIPRVFEPNFCQHLIDLYEADGGTDSGFMQQQGDHTVEVLDSTVKRRRDLGIEDPALIGQINQRIWRRVKPEIEKVFFYTITNFERYLVGCYEAGDRGFFKPHRDNTNLGSLHRRFAMTLNLNQGYEGSYLRFPEYTSGCYRPAPGEAVIFSCSLLHEATPVTQGKRLTLLSFFYNEDDAKIRAQHRDRVILR